MTPRNWAAFNRRQQAQAQRAMAEGQHRPPPLVTTGDSDQDDDHSEESDRD